MPPGCGSLSEGLMPAARQTPEGHRSGSSGWASLAAPAMGTGRRANHRLDSLVPRYGQAVAAWPDKSPLRRPSSLSLTMIHISSLPSAGLMTPVLWMCLNTYEGAG